MMTPWILIVDDDASLCSALIRIAEENGLRATCRHDADGALAVLLDGGRGPDALVLDVHLPRVSGLGVLRRLQEASVIVPTLLVSGLRVSLSRDHLRNLGCDSFLEKPFTGEAFIRRILSILSGPTGESGYSMSEFDAADHREDS